MGVLDRKDLHDYQELSVKHLIDNPYSALFLDMGAGKTVSTLTAVDYLMYSDLSVMRALVVGPKRVAENVWPQEIEKWEHLKHLKISVISGAPAERIAAANIKADIYTIGRELFVWLCELYKYKLPYDLIIFDELSSFKDSKSKRFKAAKKVRPRIRRVIGLTGTPAPNSLRDLWAQIYLLDLGKRLGRFKTGFDAKFFELDPYRPFTYTLREGAQEEIHSVISDICISLSNADTGVKLPPLIINHVKLKFDETLQKQYKEFEKEKIIELLDESEGDSSEGTVISVASAAALFIKLSQFSNGAVYDEERNVKEIHELKLDALEDLVEETQGSPMLIAYNFIHDKDRILRKLKKYKPVVLKSSEDLARWNAGKIQVALAHPASLGHGLNLQAGGHYITWFSLTSSLELYQQFNARLFRQGQKESVVISIISIQDTLDDRLHDILTNKDTTQGSLLKAVRAKVEDFKKTRQ